MYGPPDKSNRQEWLAWWYWEHTDLHHPGSRDACSHCQEVIRRYGEMPPLAELKKYRPPKKGGYEKKLIDKATRQAVFNRDGYACLKCGATDDLTVDRIIPEVKNGPNTLENFQTLCRKCNSQKGIK